MPPCRKCDRERVPGRTLCPKHLDAAERSAVRDREDDENE